MSQQLRSVGPVSVAKVMAVLYAIFGLLIGAVLSLVFSFASIAGSAGFPGGTRSGPMGLLFGVGSIIFLPILYAIFGAIGGLIAAGLYNIVAKYTGGIEIEIG
jgi:hypothetical protein